MRTDKAQALVSSILRTHAEAVSATSPEAVEALRNAEADLVGLISQVVAECGDERNHVLSNDGDYRQNE